MPTRTRSALMLSACLTSKASLAGKTIQASQSHSCDVRRTAHHDGVLKAQNSVFYDHAEDSKITGRR